MQQLRTRPRPEPNQLWLSRPPYLMIARIVEVGRDEDRKGFVSYVLYDEAGSTLEHVDRAPLADEFWRAFQPLTAHQG